LVGGTRRLIEAMVADGRPDVVLSSPVAAVDQDGDGATVTMRDGQTFSARAVVVTVPLNALRALEFRPALSGGKQAAMAGGQDWVADEFWRGTWPVYRPRQLTRYLGALQQSEGRVFLAGSEAANGWCGLIDGAIESGLTAARRVAELLDQALFARSR